METKIVLIVLIVVIMVILARCVRVVQQSKAYVIERLGALHSLECGASFQGSLH